MLELEMTVELISCTVEEKICQKIDQLFLISSLRPSSPLTFQVHLSVLHGEFTQGQASCGLPRRWSPLAWGGNSQVESSETSFLLSSSKTLQVDNWDIAKYTQTMKQGSCRRFSESVKLSVQGFNRHQSRQSVACLRNRKWVWWTGAEGGWMGGWRLEQRIRRPARVDHK